MSSASPPLGTTGDGAKAVHADVASGKVVKTPNGPLADYGFKAYSTDDDAILFTPPGFAKIGVPAVASGADVATIRLVVTDKASDKPTPCRVNVVGPDGQYYEPAENPLSRYSLTGQWPTKGWGNRFDKAPMRYFGRFFYSRGESEVTVPVGSVRVEVWKGFEYRPEIRVIEVQKGETRRVDIALEHPVPMPELGYSSGDPHVHIPRATDGDDQTAFDLLEAEDIHHATLLAYNEPAGPYTAAMAKLASPQSRGLGKASIRTRGAYSLISGQEYRSSTYGHMNLFLLDELVLPGQSTNADNWPLYGDLVRKARETGGVAFYAHGGYAQSIYADVVQGNIDAVELLQFGVYRGIGLTDWYRMLNSGFRIPAVGACDYPACRKLGDCITYVQSDAKAGIEGWLRGASAGRGFVTTGPLLLLEVDGKKPGATIEATGPGPKRVVARVRVRSEVAPVSNLELIVNGRVVAEQSVNVGTGLDRWIELERTLELDRSSWVAARAYSLSRLGSPDAEAHTNPVYVTLDGKAPYDRPSLDELVRRLDGQIAAHKARAFPEKARVLAYFDKSRDILLKVREAGGRPASQGPSELSEDRSNLDDPGRRTHSEEELRAFLKPIPPKPVDEALRGFDTIPGFHMELVASEPLVVSPTAASFDEDGRLYVAEMVDYPYMPKAGKTPLGGIKLLEDEDGDGRFDRSYPFADHLLWAAGIAPWKGGVFVSSPPDIWYLKDTDGDRKADVREKVYTGFGLKNQQAMLNNLQWGLDHRIYGSTAGNGGSITRPSAPKARAIDVDGRDFRFDPKGFDFEAITGTIQFGNTFDDWGNRFLCSESQPLLHVVLPLHYLARNPYLTTPNPIENLAPPPVPIFRISPVERWRQIRSSRRIAHNNRSATSAGASHHVVDAAAGVTVYRGGAYPERFSGNVFVGDAQNNLIHRRTLEPSGATFRSDRADKETEVVRSPDNWFRPVNFVNAPDGTLYVLDMSREYLESIHIPSDVVKYLDLTSGRDHGRIYRLAPEGFRYPGTPHLGRASTAELVDALESPHGWWRDTAHRLLYERQDPTASPLLRWRLAESRRPETRLLALWSLQGLGALTDNDLARALADASPHVRRHALALSETKLASAPAILETVLATPEEEPSVRFQRAFTLGQTKDPRAIESLARIARASEGDPWTRTAVLSSVGETSDALLNVLSGDSDFLGRTWGGDFVVELASIVGARGRGPELGRLFESLATNPAFTQRPTLRSRLALAAAESLRRGGGWLDLAITQPDSARTFVAALQAEALQAARDSSASVSHRQAAIRLFACVTFPKVQEVFAGLLDVREPVEVQSAVVRALGGYPEPEVAEIVLSRWKTSTPDLRSQALETLLNREDRTSTFLRAVEDGRVEAAQIDASWRTRLLAHRNEAIRRRAQRLLGGQVAARRQQVVDGFRPALKLVGVADRGKSVFTRECSVCHRIGETGQAVGPDLTSSSARDPETLLVHILDPNRDVLPNFVQYQLADVDGRIYSGLIASQSASSVTLKKEEGKTETIPRNRVDQLTSSGLSLMPEGFELKISRQEMADLLMYLQGSQSGSRVAELPLEIGTEPGLAEPDLPPQRP